MRRFALLIAIGLALVACDDDPPPFPQTPGHDRSAGPGLVSLLDGLKPGDDLADTKVVRILAPQDGLARVVVVRGSTEFSVGILRKGKSPPDRIPALTTERYELGVGLMAGPGPINMDDLLPAAKAVEERIRRREATVPMPAGL